MRSSLLRKRYFHFLGYTIAGQSRAYGFTLVIWSTGAITIGRQGLPSELGVALFIMGALAALAIVIVLAFPSRRARYRPGAEPQRYAYGLLHVPSVAMGIAAGWLASRWFDGPPSFFVAALAAVLVFELVLAGEIMMTAPHDGPD